MICDFFTKAEETRLCGEDDNINDIYSWHFKALFTKVTYVPLRDQESLDTDISR